VKPPGIALLVPPEVATLTATLPATCDGVVNVSEVEELTVTLAAGIVVLSIVTVVLPATKLVPVTVATVPPDSGPAAGEIAVTVGFEAATTIKLFVVVKGAPTADPPDSFSGVRVS
jgi:hypothetical protein